MATATLGTPENKVEAIYAKKIYADSYNGIPIGIPLPMPTNGEVPVGFIEYNGASLSRAMYPDLFAFLGTAYGAEDELHFNVPDMRGKFWQGDDIAGIAKEAGLPNIEGRSGWLYSNSGYDGAFKNTPSAYAYTRLDSGSGNYQQMAFDASLSNPIYGKSTTVQPPAITCRWIAKAFDAATPDSALVDMTQVANELNGKANRDLSNLTEAGKKVISCAYSDTYIILHSETSNVNTVTVTAPANGFISVNVGNAGTNWYNIADINANFILDRNGNSQGLGMCSFIPAKKDHQYEVKAGSSLGNIVFYFTEGEV